MIERIRRFLLDPSRKCRTCHWDGLVEHWTLWKKLWRDSSFISPGKCLMCEINKLPCKNNNVFVSCKHERLTLDSSLNLNYRACEAYDDIWRHWTNEESHAGGDRQSRFLWEQLAQLIPFLLGALLSCSYGCTHGWKSWSDDQIVALMCKTMSPNGCHRFSVDDTFGRCAWAYPRQLRTLEGFICSRKKSQRINQALCPRRVVLDGRSFPWSPQRITSPWVSKWFAGGKQHRYLT